MDLDRDGCVDVLSGSYSRKSPDMAGLFWLLRGKEAGGFEVPISVRGEDGEPLILRVDAATEERDAARLDRIRTRPFAVDLNDDGWLDIVAGNLRGEFGVFFGTARFRFRAQPRWLENASGRLAVPKYSDPVLFDLDSDCDADLLSGSMKGGVYLFENVGTSKEPRFGPRQQLLAPVQQSEEIRFGDDHVRAPGRSTRVWVGDVNRDGKADLLIGDSHFLNFAAEGHDEASARAALAAWKPEFEALTKKLADAAGSGHPERLPALRQQVLGMQRKKSSFLRTRGTGYVWVAYGR